MKSKCLRKTFPRAGPPGVLSAEEMGFQHLFAPLSSAKRRHEAAQQEQAVALTCGGSMGYLALSNMKIQTPKAITSCGVSIQACNQGQKQQLGGDSSVPFAVCGPWDFLQTPGSYLRPSSPARGWQSPACCHQLL